MGEKNPAWKGGASFEPYLPDFNGALKDFVREANGWVCKLCNKTQKENGKKLSVHHIDYNKENNESKNLIPLCASCNSKVNGDRDFWQKHFEKLERRNYELFSSIV